MLFNFFGLFGDDHQVMGDDAYLHDHGIDFHQDVWNTDIVNHHLNVHQDVQVMDFSTHVTQNFATEPSFPMFDGF